MIASMLYFGFLLALRKRLSSDELISNVASWTDLDWFIPIWYRTFLIGINREILRVRGQVQYQKLEKSYVYVWYGNWHINEYHQENAILVLIKLSLNYDLISKLNNSTMH